MAASSLYLKAMLTGQVGIQARALEAAKVRMTPVPRS